MKLLRLGRFERRVVSAIAAVALVPILGALVLGRGVLAEAYRVGVNPRVREQLDRGLVKHAELHTMMRAHADRTADAIAFDYRLVDAMRRRDHAAVQALLDARLAEHEHVAAIRVVDLATEDVLAESVRPLDPALFQQVLIERAFEPDGDPVLASVVVRVTAAAPTSSFESLRDGAELFEVYRRLEDSTSYFSGSYLAVYIALLLGVAILSLLVGIVASRRVTRRVVVLADATARVGRGDLTVEVPVDEKDEVDELTRAFNAMVRDIRTSRDRIEYLQRVGAWQEMARRLAHEIKNPLTPIQLAVQQAHESYRGDDRKYRRTLDDVRDIVEEEIATLRRLVKEFSEFARLPTPELEPADLRSFARDVVTQLDPAALASEGEAPKPGLPIPTLRLEIDDDAPLPVAIDTQMLRRCLDNLVRNAVQAIVGQRGRSTPGEVVVATRRDGDDAVLEVRDDGPGVPVAARDRVFDPYYTTRDEGTGLGLAIVKKVVLEHGGAIACGEAPEGGAAFRIRLPVRRDGEHVAPTAPSDEA